MLKFPSKIKRGLRLRVRLFNPLLILKQIFATPFLFYLFLSDWSFLVYLVQLCSRIEILSTQKEIVFSLILTVIAFLVAFFLLICHIKRSLIVNEFKILLIVVVFLGVQIYLLLFLMGSKLDFAVMNFLLVWKIALKTCRNIESKIFILIPFASFLMWKLDLFENIKYPTIILFFGSIAFVVLRKNMKIKKVENGPALYAHNTKIELEKTRSQNDQLQILNSLQEAIIIFDSSLNLQYSNPCSSLLFFKNKVLTHQEIEKEVLFLRQDETFLKLHGHIFSGKTDFTHLIEAFKSKMALFGSIVTEFNEESHTSNFSKKTLRRMLSGPMHKRQSRDLSKPFPVSWAERIRIKDSKDTTPTPKDKKLKLKNLYFLNQNVNSNPLTPKSLDSIKEAKSMREILKSFFELQLTNFHFFLHAKDPKTILLVSLELFDGNALVLIKAFDRKDPLFSVWDMYEAQNKLLSSMCHELRTPLNSITNMLELMESIEDDIESEYPNRTHYREYLNSAILNSKLLLSNINDFLDYFSFGANIFEINAKCFNIRELLIECEAIFCPLSARKMVNFFVRIPELDSYICINDEERIKQIIINLLNNAFKFTSSGGTIILQLKSRDDVFEVLITDTGVGMEPQQLKFLGNFQEGCSLGLKGATSLGGFGLTISNIVANYIGPSDKNGKSYKGIKVRSEKSKGSRFSFLIDKTKSGIEYMDSFGENTAIETKTKNIARLTRTPLPPCRFLTPNVEFTANPISPFQCGCPKILAVDDNEFNLFVLTEQFKKYSLGIDTSSGGVEAVLFLEGIIIDTSIKFCKKCRFYKLILMDIDMPIKDGFEATKEIKEMLNGTGIEVKIVALSAFNQEKVKEKMLQAGFVDYVEKPFSFTKMQQLIHKYL